MKTIFVTSSGRSGTKSLYKALVTIPGVRAFHGAHERLEKENNFRYRGIQLDWAISQLKLKRRPLVRSVIQGRSHFVECTWFLTAFTKDLVDLFPEALIVHLVRDGRDFVRSGMARPWFANDSRYSMSVHAWSRDKFCPPPSCKNRFEKICWLWAEQQKLIKQQQSTLLSVNNGGVIRMENLIGKDLTPLFSRWGILPDKWNRKIIMPRENATTQHVIPPWKQWDRELRKSAVKWMGKELTAFGYKWA